VWLYNPQKLHGLWCHKLYFIWLACL
jgi:hypothetical protein